MDRLQNWFEMFLKNQNELSRVAISWCWLIVLLPLVFRRCRCILSFEHSWSPLHEGSGGFLHERRGGSLHECSGCPFHESCGCPLYESSGCPFHETSGWPFKISCRGSFQVACWRPFHERCGRSDWKFWVTLCVLEVAGGPFQKLSRRLFQKFVTGFWVPRIVFVVRRFTFVLQVILFDTFRTVKHQSIVGFLQVHELRVCFRIRPTPSSAEK